MATGYVANPGDMIRVSNDVVALVDQYNAKVNRLYEITGELDTMWDGDANTQFKLKFEADRDRFIALSNMLKSYIEAVQTVANNYIKAEEAAKQVIMTNKTR